MKKCMLLILTVVLSSCTSLQSRGTTAVYQKIEADTPVYLRSIILEPPHILDGIGDELPGLIESCLINSGFKIADHLDPDRVDLDVFLHRKEWQLNFNSYESITLRLLLTANGQTVAYILHTEDTDRSINSFPWTFSLIEENIRKLNSAVNVKE